MRENHKNHINHTPIKLIAMAFRKEEESTDAEVKLTIAKIQQTTAMMELAAALMKMKWSIIEDSGKPKGEKV